MSFNWYYKRTTGWHRFKAHAYGTTPDVSLPHLGWHSSGSAAHQPAQDPTTIGSPHHGWLGKHYELTLMFSFTRQNRDSSFFSSETYLNLLIWFRTEKLKPLLEKQMAPDQKMWIWRNRKSGRISDCEQINTTDETPRSNVPQRQRRHVIGLSRKPFCFSRAWNSSRTTGTRWHILHYRIVCKLPLW